MAGIRATMRTKSLKYFGGEEPDDGALQVLLVSTSQEYLDKVQRALFTTRQIQACKRTYNVKVHTCKHISDVITLKSSDFTVDFIVFIMDVNYANSLAEVKSNLTLLDSSFGREKMCILNPRPSYDRAAINPFDLWDFAHTYQINLINGKIDDEEGLNSLTKRILNLAEACCGLLNGIPLVGYV